VTTRGVAAGLVLAVLLAGCFGSPGATPTPERSPTATPERSPTPTPVQPPPGVGNGSLEDVDALLGSHRQSLTGVGFVAEVRIDGRTTRYAYATDGSRLIDRVNGSTTTWGNDTVAVRRTAGGGEVAYERIPIEDLSVDGFLVTTQLRERLTSASYERNGTTSCGDATCVVLTATRGIGGTVRNVTAEVHVDPQGVIRALDAEWVRSTDGQAFTFRFTVEEVGTSSVDRPDWVPEALNETG
jgi:hypothetical protein